MMNYQNDLQRQNAIIKEVSNLAKKQTLLLHTCCAMCFSAALWQIKDYFDITVYFFNPNIYPSEEYDKRKNEVKRMIEIFNKEYSINIKFVEEIEEFEKYNRCKIHKEKCYDCIQYRLYHSYVYADAHNFDYVTTTLTSGRLKNSKMINRIGENLSEHFKTKYFYSDFKKNKGIDVALMLKEKYNIYAQNYCGCEPYYETN